jgi:hypothetical protein
LLRQLKELDVGAGDAYVTRQGFDCRGPAPAAARSRADAQQASPY